jgi:hypothetical protein
MTRKRTLSAAVLLALLTVLVAMQAGAAMAKNGDHTTKILEWQTMVGVPQALTGTQAPIRSINGGGIPWTLTAAKGELSTTGHLEIKVDGLVLATTLSNPSATFRAIVSCLATDGSVQNVQTATFPATTGLASAGGGDATIEADVALAQPCIAPIVFVTSAGGSWFASTGG